MVTRTFLNFGYVTCLLLVQHLKLKEWIPAVPCGKLQIVIATVAFGMGLDYHKIVHRGPPLDLEGYIQETGQAGKMGR